MNTGNSGPVSLLSKPEPIDNDWQVSLTIKIHAHLALNGNCLEAFEFYESPLGGSLAMTSFDDSPAANHVPQEWKERIVHGTLSLEKSEIAGADVPPYDYKKLEGFIY